MNLNIIDGNKDTYIDNFEYLLNDFIYNGNFSDETCPIFQGIIRLNIKCIISYILMINIKYIANLQKK